MASTHLLRVPVPELELRKGEHLVKLFCSDMAPCRCTTHVRFTVRCGNVAWHVDGLPRRYHLRCLNCGAKWSRAFPAHARSDMALYLDASHPEEVIAKRMRIAEAALAREHERQVRAQRLAKIKRAAKRVR